jgi:hypothetical protein
MPDRLTELLQEVAREDPMVIFLGAVAAAEDRTLVTDIAPFIKLMKEYAEKSFLVAQRFLPVFESLEFYQGYWGQIQCPQIHYLFRRLNNSPFGISWAFEFTGSYRGNRYHLTDKSAFKVLEEYSISPEEFDFLWIVAQRIHLRTDQPVRARECFAIPA